MAGTRRNRRLGSITVTAVVMASLSSLLIWNGPAAAVAHKGLNGLIACGGTTPTTQANVVDFEIFTFNPDGSNRTNVTDESVLTDYNPVFTPDGQRILYETEFVGQVIDDTFELVLMNNGANPVPVWRARQRQDHRRLRRAGRPRGGFRPVRYRTGGDLPSPALLTRGPRGSTERGAQGPATIG